MNGGTTWTAEQTATLTRLWNSGLSASLIARQVGFSRGAVLGKLHRLGLLNRRPTTMPTVRTSRLWPEENVALLRRLYAEGKSYETIALACGVSKASVRNKAQNLGLRRRAIRTRWTDERVDQLRRLRMGGCACARAAGRTCQKQNLRSQASPPHSPGRYRQLMTANAALADSSANCRRSATGVGSPGKRWTRRLLRAERLNGLLNAGRRDAKQSRIGMAQLYMIKKMALSRRGARAA